MTQTEFRAWLSSTDQFRCLLVVVQALVAGQETTRYLSNVGYVAGPATWAPNQVFDPCISGGLKITETLPESGEPSIGWGDVEISNVDGAKDSWLYDVWAGRPAVAWVGDVRWPLEDFVLVFTGVAEDIGSSDRGSLNISIRDRSQRLNSAMTGATLGGTGPNANNPPPLCFGEVHNIAPVLFHQPSLTYRVHEGPIERVIEVRDNGVPVTFTSDLANGSFSLPLAPFGEVTASVQGAKPGGVYLNRVGSLIQHIATTYGEEPLQLGEVSVNAFDAAHPQPVGVYVKDRTNALEVCQKLASSVGGQVSFNTAGALTLLKLASPQSGGPEVNDTHTISGSLQVARTLKPKANVRVAFCKNWQVQQPLASGLPSDHAALFGQEWLTATAGDTNVATAWKQTTSPVDEPTLLLRTQDAFDEASRRLTMWSARRTVFRLSVWGAPIDYRLGDTITLRSDRFDLTAGKPGIVVGRTVDWLKATAELEVLT